MSAGAGSVSASHEGPLVIAARAGVIEAAPLLYATRSLGADKAVFVPGSVESLFVETDGRADLAGNAETQALRVSVDHPDLRILGTVVEGLYGIVARRSAGIARLSDLRGRRVGTAPETSAAYFLNRMLRTCGMSEADITVIPGTHLTLAASIADGVVDAIAIWEPEARRAAEALGGDAIEFSDSGTYREIYGLNTTASALADPKRRCRIVEFVGALAAACEICTTRPEAVWPLVAQSSGFDVGLIAACWPHHRFSVAVTDDLLEILEDQEVWLASTAGRSARGRSELSELIDTSMIKSMQAKSAEAPFATRNPLP